MSSPQSVKCSGVVLKQAVLCLCLLWAFVSLRPVVADANTDIRAGDVLLVPLNCYVCNAIEQETGTPYSHSVVVANNTSNPTERYVYEAWGEVKKTPLTEILKRKQKNQNLYQLRAKEFLALSATRENELRQRFDESFLGLPFDDEYLWNNLDATGHDKLYCSEFVIKFLNSFLRTPVRPQPMSFDQNREFWVTYYQQFGLQVPEGEMGGSPSTLFFSPLFIHLGEIN
jgi:hypothetical protein